MWRRFFLEGLSMSTVIQELTFRDLIALAYALYDLSTRSSDPSSSTGMVQKICLNQYEQLLVKLEPDSKDALFLTRFLLEATSLAHHIEGAARTLKEDRELSRERHSLSLSREAAITGFSALARLSGQLFLIGGGVGIISWIFLGNTQKIVDDYVQILMSTAIAFGSMVFGMAWQLRSMSNAQKKIDGQYYLDLDRVKEKQIDRLIAGLKRAQEMFCQTWIDRFESPPSSVQSDMDIEIRMLSIHRTIGDRDLDDFQSGFILFLKRVFGFFK
jgi:hypothetical protein